MPSTPSSVAAEAEALAWIEEVTGRKRENAPIEEWLHDGTILCELINAIKPERVTRAASRATQTAELNDKILPALLGRGALPLGRRARERGAEQHERAAAHLVGRQHLAEHHRGDRGVRDGL